MSKEQLEKSKLLADMIRKETRLPHNFPYELIDWLIEQAEQNERYREALMTIAVGDNHFARYEDIARKALEESE